MAENPIYHRKSFLSLFLEVAAYFIHNFDAIHTSYNYHSYYGFRTCYDSHQIVRLIYSFTEDNQRMAKHIFDHFINQNLGC